MSIEDVVAGTEVVIAVGTDDANVAEALIGSGVQVPTVAGTEVVIAV